jgi:hypothetical protein
MGIFKGLKEMKTMVTTAPDMIRGTLDIAANAQAIGQASAAQAAAFQFNAAQTTAVAADLSPIAGVDIATYGWVTKQIAAHGYDQSLLVGFAAQKGIDSASWQQAVAGWGARMTNPAVASEFRRNYDAS